MIAEKQESISKTPSPMKKVWPWLNLGLTVILLGVGLWYLTSKVSPAEMGAALTLANGGYIALSVAAMVATIGFKAWRWQWLLMPRAKPLPFPALLWSTTLGQYVNLVVPFLRLGEIARIYALNRQTGAGKARALGTLVVEKTLDMILLILTLIVLLPLVVLPEFVSNPGLLFGGVSFAALFVLYLLAYQTNLVIRVIKWFTRRLPAPLERRLMQLMISGLEGLSALRNQQATLVILGMSAVIAMLSILTPYLLFLALNIPSGLVEAALIHVVVSIASTPPSTPGKIGVFDGAVAFMLVSFNLTNQAVIASYTIIFHLVVLLPQILLGSIAASRTNWRWQRSV